MNYYKFTKLHRKTASKKTKTKQIRASQQKEKKKILLYSLISHHLSKQRLLEYYLLKKLSVADNLGLILKSG